MSESRILLISPVFNEAAHIERVIEGVAAQEHRPARWIVVDDGSTDGTLELLRRWEPRLGFMEVIGHDLPEGKARVRDGLARAREAARFNEALALANLDEYDFVGKLDGDVELAPEHFRQLTDRFAADRELGIAGTMLVEPAGRRWTTLRIPAHHVHGAVKLYSRECFEAIGGVEELLGWDVVDEAYARMHGYRTRTFRELEARHLRPEGSAAGRLRGRARAGEVAYIVGYDPWWVVPRAGKVALSRPYVASGVAFLYGYARARVRRRERLGDEAYRRFVRRELLDRLRRRLRLWAAVS